MSRGDSDDNTELDPRMLRAPAPETGPTIRERAIRVTRRLLRELSGRHWIGIEYPPPEVEQPRWGWGNPPSGPLTDLLEQHTAAMRETIALIESYGSALRAIPVTSVAVSEPHWDQQWFGGLDAATLYAFVRSRRPARYVEVGSGHSTLFAARAVRDGGLATRITSIDPQPRAAVDAVCDEVVRSRFEFTDLEVVGHLSAGDVLLIDSSHHTLMNSDVTAFFLDALPVIRPGVLIGVHDIFLPQDYPWWLADRWYSEQYLLAAWLLGARGRTSVRMAAHHVATDRLLRPQLDAAWARIGLQEVLAYGSGFWFET